MNKYYYSFLCMLIIPLAGMSTDIYIPSLPAMATHFLVAKALTQYTVTSYVLAMGVGQLFAGPLSDAYGRKKLLLSALLLQVICVIAILHSPTIAWVIVERFLQGLGAAFMIVPARAILNDIFKGDQLKKHFQYLTIAFAMGPIIAPYIGGYLQEYIGWEANFYFILIYGLVLTGLITFTLKETSQNMHAFSIDKVWKNYWVILSNKHFLIGAILLGMLFGYSTLFNVAGTFIIQKALNLSSVVYGWSALLMGFAWFLGNIISRLTFHLSKSLKTKFSIIISFITAIVFFVLTLKGYFNLIVLVAPTFILVLLSGVIFTTYVAEYIGMFPKLAASVNGVLFAIIWGIFSVFTVLATLLRIHSLFPVALAFLLVSVACLSIYFVWVLPLEKQ